MIKLSAISKNYQTDKVQTRALDNINLQVQAGEFVSIMGPSGCGKSTLAKTLLRLIKPMQGELLFENQNILHMKNNVLQKVFSVGSIAA